jgi:putative peptidoglycan lipid II flippase
MNFLNKKTNTVEKSAIIIGFFTLLSSFLGIFRNSLLAIYLGSGRNIDIYYASFRIPDFIFNIFIMGAVTAGLIPLFSKYIHNKKEEANDFINSVIHIILILSAVFAIILSIFAVPIIDKLFSGMDPASKLMVVKITRVIMLQPIILGLSAILGNILLVCDFVISFALAPLLYNLGIIFGILFLYPKFGLIGLGYGVVLGAILNLIVKFVPMRLTDIKISFVSFYKMKKYIKEFASLVLPRTLSVINIQIFLFVVNYFASFLEEGRLGIFNLANSFQDLPQTIFATSIAMAAFPLLSKMYNQKDVLGMKGLYIKSLNQITFIILLISSGLFVLRYPLVKVLLHYGRFDITGIKVTADVLQIMSLGLIFASLLLLNLDTLFALNDMMTPLIASFVAYGIGSVLIVIWYKDFGILGITFAMVIANMIYFKIMTWKIIKMLKIDVYPMLIKISKNLLIAVLSGIIGLLCYNYFNQFGEGNWLKFVGFSLIIPCLSILLVYLLLAKLFRFEELNNFWKILYNKIRRI